MMRLTSLDGVRVLKYISLIMLFLLNQDKVGQQEDILAWMKKKEAITANDWERRVDFRGLKYFDHCVCLFWILFFSILDRVDFSYNLEETWHSRAHQRTRKYRERQRERKKFLGINFEHLHHSYICAQLELLALVSWDRYWIFVNRTFKCWNLSCSLGTLRLDNMGLGLLSTGCPYQLLVKFCI